MDKYIQVEIETEILLKEISRKITVGMLYSNLFIVYLNVTLMFNAFALAKVWRARVLDALKKHPELSRMTIKTLPVKWVVDCKKVGDGLPALKYLSQYLSQATKHTLPVLKFLLLILQHVLPKGLQRVPDYGVLS